MDIEQLYDLYRKYRFIDTDTRKLRQNSIYFALKGGNFDGNKFVEEALNSGAALCVIDDDNYSIEGKTILVEDVLKTLQELARFHRNQLEIPVIGLTGSNGKTTSKELIKIVLSKKYKTFATHGNLNNHIGVPISILSIQDDIEMAIIEMGANHQKEIEFLASISNPDYGFITNFGKAHMEGFGGVEGIIKGKSELYQNIRQNKKKVFVNEEDLRQMELTADLDRMLFRPSAIRVLAENPFLSLSFENIDFKTHLIGSYNSLNIAIAICIGQYFGVELDDVISAITAYKPNNNRSQLIRTANNEIHLDAYNANPSSMELAIRSFAKLEGKNKVLVLGDMFELGVASKTEHQTISDLCESLGLNKVYLIGENFFQTDTKYHRFKDYERFQKAFQSLEFTGVKILIKGSRGMALERILDHIN